MSNYLGDTKSHSLASHLHLFVTGLKRKTLDFRIISIIKQNNYRRQDHLVAFYITQKYFGVLQSWQAYRTFKECREDSFCYPLVRIPKLRYPGEELEVLSIRHCLQKTVVITWNAFDSMIVLWQKQSAKATKHYLFSSLQFFGLDPSDAECLLTQRRYSVPHKDLWLEKRLGREVENSCLSRSRPQTRAE